MRIFQGVIVALALAFLIVFAMFNAETGTTMTISLLLTTLKNITVLQLTFGAFFFGLLVGFFLFVPDSLRLMFKCKGLWKKNRQLEKELQTLRDGIAKPEEKPKVQGDEFEIEEKNEEMINH